MLESVLQSKDAEEMFNRLRLYVMEVEGMSMSELVSEAKKFIRHAVNFDVMV
jgi:ribosomal protein L12E/L44/L45/RPP1/RPP2